MNKRTYISIYKPIQIIVVKFSVIYCCQLTFEKDVCVKDIRTKSEIIIIFIFISFAFQISPINSTTFNIDVKIVNYDVDAVFLLFTFALSVWVNNDSRSHNLWQDHNKTLVIIKLMNLKRYLTHKLKSQTAY